MSAYALYINDDSYAVTVTQERYELSFYNGALPGDVWQKKTIYIDTLSNTVQNDLFAGEVGDIIYINSQPVMWANNGATQGDIIKTGDTLDFTAIGGIQGWLHFEYRRIP